MTPDVRILLLGGTTEASQIVSVLEPDPRITLTLSLAGRTVAPRMSSARVRIGGFGGVAGLVAYLQGEQIALLVDATHPFAAVMPFHAAQACRLADVPLLKVYRPPWFAVAGDRWIRVPDLRSAAETLQRIGARRVLLTTGRTELDPFRGVPRMTFVVRSIEAADLRDFVRATAVLDRGPFDLASERALLVEHAIDVLVTKNSGGSAAAPKLQAARELGISVVMVERPPIPAVTRLERVDQAVAWINRFVSPTDTSVA